MLNYWLILIYLVEYIIGINDRVDDMNKDVIEKREIIDSIGNNEKIKLNRYKY